MEQNCVLSLGASLVVFQPFPRFLSLRELCLPSKGAMETPGAISKREQSKHSKHWGRASSSYLFLFFVRGSSQRVKHPSPQLAVSQAAAEIQKF